MGLPDVDSIPDTGAVFTIGRSRFADNFASHFFIRQDPVVTIVCGDEHSAVVCESGRLFVFGSNDWGQLGLGHKNHVSKPSCVKILKPEKVTNVACGRAHTLICTGGEKIFACGSDQEGQLGRGGLAVGDSSSSPILIHDCRSDESRILQIAAGSHHSMALMNDGSVIAWGSNLEGQLGLPGTSGLVNKPTKVPIPEPVKSISAGYYHTGFLTESGLIYVCGESESGKLGIVVNFSTQAAPRQLQLPDPAAKIACGGHHSLVLTETGALYCFGSNASGQLGMGANVTEVQTPKLLPRGNTEGETIVVIAVGESHTALVTESGKLFMSGDGRHGKLGLEENENNVHEITHAAKYEELVVTDVSCGGCHTMLIGKRRDSPGNVNDESGSASSDIQIAKKSAPSPSSLPPLKIPAALSGRIPGADMLTDKNIIGNALKSVENKVTEIEDNVKEKLTEAKGKLTEAKDKLTEARDKLESNVDGAVKKVTETVKEDVEAVKKTAEGVFDGVKEAVVGIGGPKKPDFPKKLADYIEEGNKTDELLNDLAGEAATAEHESKRKLTNAGTAVAEEFFGDVKGHGESDDDVEKLSTPFDIGDEKNSSKLIEIDKASPDTGPNPIPPPKPPRQRSGGHEGDLIGDDSETLLKSSSAKSPNSNGRERNVEIDEEVCAVKGVDRIDRKVGDQDEDKPYSGIPIPRGGEYKRIEGNVGAADDLKKGDNTEIETTQDDADVVQSPPPKTAGKMSKLFRGKKSAEEQNGMNGSNSGGGGGDGATKSKVKSRTCALL